MIALAPEDFTLADIKTLVVHAKALAAPEPEPFRQVRPTAEDHVRWQTWRDEATEAQAYVERLQLQ